MAKDLSIIVKYLLHKCNLVTREEFAVQSHLLAVTQAKLASLQLRLEQLEKSN